MCFLSFAFFSVGSCVLHAPFLLPVSLPASSCSFGAWCPYHFSIPYLLFGRLPTPSLCRDWGCPDAALGSLQGQPPTLAGATEKAPLAHPKSGTGCGAPPVIWFPVVGDNPSLEYPGAEGWTALLALPFSRPVMHANPLQGSAWATGPEVGCYFPGELQYKCIIMPYPSLSSAL